MLHKYGSQVHLLDSPVMTGLLARLSAPETVQPEINRLVEKLYRHLLTAAVDGEFAKESFSQATRMSATHPGHPLTGTRIARSQKAVCVNLARAGTLPSHLCYEELHGVLAAENLRQDHIMAARTTDASAHVTGTAFAGLKIGGPVKDAFVFFPDPMGATGNTLVTTIDYYKKNVEGPARKYIALHLIVTPEYLKRVLKAHPDVAIYALRLDRGLSPKAVLDTVPGEQWDLEKGLNEMDYIVPGAGGVGEIMNNSFV